MTFFFRGLFFLCILTGNMKMVQAQQVVVDPADSLFNLKFAGFKFNGEFAVKATGDELNNYYLVDMTRFPERFARVYFMNDMCKNPEVFNIDPEITRNRIWFQSNKRYPEKQIIELLNSAMKRSVELTGLYTEPEKAKWLKENDKYK